MIGTAVDQNCAARFRRSTLERGGGNSADSAALLGLIVAASKGRAAEFARAGTETKALVIVLTPANTINTRILKDTFVIADAPLLA